MVSYKKVLMYRLSIIFIFVLSFVFLIWRAKYGFCFNDEPFLISLAQRLYNGDALIAEEWHGVQNFGAIVLPFYSIFISLFKSTECILLTFRYIYCILWFSVCMTVYLTLAKKYKSAIFVFLYLVLFSPHDYMTLSYNTFGIMALLLICCIVYSTPDSYKSHSYLSAVTFSMLWIISVLCTPYMAVAYIISVAFFCSKYFFHKCSKKSYFYDNVFFYIKTSVIVIPVIAILYLYMFVFSRTELQKVIESIPFIFADPEHPSINIVTTIINLINSLNKRVKCFLALSAAISLASFAKVKLYKVRIYLFCLLGTLFVFCQYPYITTPFVYDFNYNMLYINIAGIAVYSLLENKDIRLFSTFYVYGFIYSLLLSLTSNTGLMATSLAITVAGVCSMISVCLLLNELYHQYRTIRLVRLIPVLIGTIIISVQLGSEIATRFCRTFYEVELSNLNTQITCGAAKGLYTTEKRAYNYEQTYLNLRYLLSQTDTTEKTFLSCTSAPYIYLDANLDYGTFSAWSFGYGDDLNDRVMDYISVNNHYPDIIFCFNGNDILDITQQGYSSLEYNGSYLFIKN